MLCFRSEKEQPNVTFWHESEVLPRPLNGRYRGYTGLSADIVKPS